MIDASKDEVAGDERSEERVMFALKVCGSGRRVA
jgi:hypothetical protein